MPCEIAEESCFSAISPPLGLVLSRGLRAAIALSREGLARVRIRPRRGRRAALARWQGRVSAVAHTRTNILLFITAVGPPAVLASLKPLNNTIQLPLRVPCIVGNDYTAIYYCCWASWRTWFPQTA